MRFSFDDRRWLQRAATAALPLLAVVCLLLTANDFLLSLNRSWNDARLAPSVSLLHGYPVYDEMGGPLLGNAYGPLFPLVFLPPALLPTPSLAIYAGVLITLLFYLLPAALLLRLGGKSDYVLVALAFLCFWLYTFKTPVLTGPALWLHADAPSLGFAALSMAFLFDPVRRRSSGAILASAIAAVAALGIKQPVAPLILATPVFLWLAAGREYAVRYLVFLGAAAAGTLVLVHLFLVDMGSMMFNAVYVPFQHPDNIPPGLSDAWLELGRRSLAPAAVLAVILVGELRRARAVGESPRAWFRESPWSLFLLMAIACAPISAASRATDGGSWNTMAPTLYFLLLAALLALLHLARSNRSALAGMRWKELVVAFLLVGNCALVAGNWSRLTLLPETVRGLANDQKQAAFEFVKEHPGQVYLPYDPVVTLMAEGRAYHFTWGIIAYELAGIEVDADWFRAHVPEDLRYVLTRRPVEELPLRYLPDFVLGPELPELRGWRVWARPD